MNENLKEIIKKKCSRCNLDKDLSNFRINKTTKDGLRSECKSCSKITDLKYYKNNIEKAKNASKKWFSKNIEKMKEYHKVYSKLNPEQRRKSVKKWATNNPEKIAIKNNIYSKKRRKKDPLYKLKTNIRNIISKSLRVKEYKKNYKSEQILGCSFEEFKLYLESKFEFWMVWENKGLYNGKLNYGWDLDHIIPISSAKTENDIIKLNHYTNLQPLCSKINRDVKKNKLLVEHMGSNPCV